MGVIFSSGRPGHPAVQRRGLTKLMRETFPTTLIPRLLTPSVSKGTSGRFRMTKTPRGIRTTTKPPGHHRRRTRTGRPAPRPTLPDPIHTAPISVFPRGPLILPVVPVRTGRRVRMNGPIRVLVVNAPNPRREDPQRQHPKHLQEAKDTPKGKGYSRPRTHVLADTKSTTVKVIGPRRTPAREMSFARVRQNDPS